MEKYLLIAEKPSLKRTIEAVYNKHRSEIPYEIQFMEQRGHLLTLKAPDEIDATLKKWSWETLPIAPENYGGWQYKNISEKKIKNYQTSSERFEAIKNALSAGSFTGVIHAGDPDQEGELLVCIVLEELKNKLPVKRFWSNDTTEGKILDALLNLKDDDHDPMLTNLLAAAKGRQHSDWRYGMNISRAASLKMNANVSCGRVKTPIMSMVCKRELEIQSFQPKTCYGVKAIYEEGFSGQLYDESTVTEPDEDEGDKENAGLVWFETEKEALDVIATLRNPAIVTKFESKRVETYAPKLFKLATAQIAAGKNYGFNSAKTLAVLQSLYEKGYLSYPRTDCEFISSHENFKALLNSASSVPALKPFIENIEPAAIGKVRATKKWVNDVKLTESGHSALIPTTKRPEYLSLSEDEKKIYEMVCRQFVAIFLPPLVQNKIQLHTDITEKTFKTTGKTVISAGYTVIFGTKFTDTVIPEHKKGDSLLVDKFDTVMKSTTCPKRYTDATLIAACEAPHKHLDDKRLKELGKALKIGTPATRASIIEELISKNQYLKRVKEKKTEYIIPTDSGMRIYKSLKDMAICKVDLTGLWEEKLESIRRGEMSLEELEKDMMKHVGQLVEEIRTSTAISARQQAKAVVIGVCPKCGKNLIEAEKNYYCSGYKDGCRISIFRNIWDSTVTREEYISLISGEVIEKEIRKGSFIMTRKIFFNPKTQKVEYVNNETESAYKCPKCKTALNEDEYALKCNCGFKFWKYPSRRREQLSKEEMDRFFQTGSTEMIDNLISKSGSTYSARIVLKKDLSGTEFRF